MVAEAWISCTEVAAMCSELIVEGWSREDKNLLVAIVQSDGVRHSIGSALIVAFECRSAVLQLNQSSYKEREPGIE